MNFYQRMGILPLKKRVNRDKCSFTTKQLMFGVFAIDEILRYRWTRFVSSRTLCHPVRRSTCPWIINSITFMQGVPKYWQNLLNRIFIIEHGVWRQIRSIVYWTCIWDTLLMVFTIVNTIRAGPRYPLLAPTTPCLLKGSLSEVSPPPCCFSRLPQKICDMLRFVISLI